MNEKIRRFLTKHREFIRYVIVGAGTTAINLVVFYLLSLMGDPSSKLNTMLWNSIAWAAAVIFSYFASRSFVYGSKASTAKSRIREFTGFALSRALTLALEDVALVALVATGANSRVAKLPVSVIVVIVNYITGHLVFHGARESWSRFISILKRNKRV